MRVRGFPALATSYAINELGDNLGVIALAILVLDRTDCALAVTLLFVAGKFLPALAAPALTAALDHRRVSRVLPSLYALEAGAFVALAALAGRHAFWLPAVAGVRVRRRAAGADRARAVARRDRGGAEARPARCGTATR